MAGAVRPGLRAWARKAVFALGVLACVLGLRYGVATLLPGVAGLVVTAYLIGPRGCQGSRLGRSPSAILKQRSVPPRARTRSAPHVGESGEGKGDRAGRWSVEERQFGKGSIMRLGNGRAAHPGRPGHLHRLHLARHRARRRRRAARPHHRDLRAGVLRQDHPRPPRRRRGPEEGRHLRRTSTPSTRSTSATRASSACAPTTCSSPSRTPASRRWRSPRCWSAPAPSTCWWSTRWRPSCPRPSSRARWATRTWACRRGS